MTRDTIFKKAGLISRYWAQIGNITIFGLMLLSTADVIGRYIFKAPVLGAYEITEYLMLISVLAYMGITQSDKAHINVDIVFNHLSPKVQAVLERINHSICLLIAILLTWRGVIRMLNLMETGEESIQLKIPEYPFAIFLIISFIVFTIEFFSDVFGPKKADNQKTTEDKA